ncbi:MAG TPA: MerR family transcriptional regulator [Ktedonobacteraceae bacterium]|nr:MerR family transcriptional regulator [Ktedonobacteraceae bacterium]
MREQLHIGEVATLVGVSPKTIRYYHEVGLLGEPERTEAGYRLYTAQDLLRLQRIRRLRALGLPLERIKEILGKPDREHEPALRHALQMLVEELTAQILELEERRDRLQKLLALDTVEQAHLPGEQPVLYLDLVKEHLGAYLSHISEDSWKWSEKIDAMLGSFNWPADYRQMLQEMVLHVAAQPEQYRQLLALEERFAALAEAPEDSPEVERLVEAYTHSDEVGLLHSTISANTPFMSSQLEHTLADMAAAISSPAQRRFFQEMARRLAKTSEKNKGISNSSNKE